MKALKTNNQRLDWLTHRGIDIPVSANVSDLDLWKFYIIQRYAEGGSPVDSTIHTVDDVKAFFADLLAGSLIFHPDTHFADYVTFGHGDVSSPLFDTNEVAILERLRERCFWICRKAGGDAIYALSLECAEDFAGRNKKPSAMCPNCHESTALDKLTPTNIERGSVQCPHCRNFFQLETAVAPSQEVKTPYKTKFITEITVTDPDSGGEVEIEIHKDMQSGALLGIDSSFIEQMADIIPSPYNEGERLFLSEDAPLFLSQLSALDQIAALLEGKEWNVDTLISISEIILATGRTIKDVQEAK